MACDSSFFHGNRTRLIESLGGDSLVILTAFMRVQRKADSAFPFEQEGNFWYLTGIEEPGWLIIINGLHGKTSLVAPDIEEWQRVFDGSLSSDEALKISGADEVLTIKEAKELLTNTLADRVVATVWPDKTLLHYGFAINPAQTLLVKRLKRTYGEVRDCTKELKQLRAIKQPVEITAIKSAVDITVLSLRDLMPKLSQMSSEREVEAYLTYRFLSHGAEGHAYDPIVAAGGNACTLHYVKNRDKLKPTDWLLLDVGARTNGYAADITRTIPLGEVTSRQRELYEAVANVHDIAVELCRPGVAVAEYHAKTQAAMLNELKRLNLVHGNDDIALRTYFPHSISHGLGIDVHDSLAAAEHFKEGMVLTVEPGIYVTEEAIGIRIENDIHITSNGPENLSKNMPHDLRQLIALKEL